MDVFVILIVMASCVYTYTFIHFKHVQFIVC